MPLLASAPLPLNSAAAASDLHSTKDASLHERNWKCAYTHIGLWSVELHQQSMTEQEQRADGKREMQGRRANGRRQREKTRAKGRGQRAMGRGQRAMGRVKGQDQAIG